MQADLTVTLDFYSVWYRDHLIPFRAKYEQKFFGFTGPNIQVHTLKPGYNERRYSEFHNIVNKKGLTNLFVILRFECTYILTR